MLWSTGHTQPAALLTSHLRQWQMPPRCEQHILSNKDELLPSYEYLTTIVIVSGLEQVVMLQLLTATYQGHSTGFL